MEDRGYVVELRSRPGVVPGAQVTGIKGTETRNFAIRACLARKVRGVRREGGAWKTLPNVDEVVVVAPSLGDPSVVDVLGFDSDVVVQALESALADQLHRGLNPKPDEPVFVSLDERHPRRGERTIPGLKSKAKWSRVLPTGRARQTETMTEAEHEILDQYLTTILRKCKEGQIDEKNAVLDIAHAFTKLQNEGLGSVLTYFRATLDEGDN